MRHRLFHGAALAVCAALFIALTMAKAGAPATAAKSKAVAFYVAPNGNDAAAGRPADKPFATLQRARDAVRALKAKGLATPVEVVIRGGTYDLSEPLVLTPADSGTAACPITWRSQEGERVLIRGAHKITGWKPWRNGIYQADLKAQGLKGVSFHQLFYRQTGKASAGFSERLTLARYPNFDPQHPRSGGYLYIPKKPANPKEQLVYDEGDIPWDKWKDISQAEIFSVYGHGWHFAISPILSVDRQMHTITVPRVKVLFYRLNRFFIQNVLDALDSPGEWYLDRKESILYVYPPAGGFDGEVTAPVIDNIFEVRGTIPFPYDYLNMAYRGPVDKCPLPADAPPLNPVEHVVFRNLDFECARQDALRLTGIRECQVVKCRIANVGNTGINVGGALPAFAEEGNPRITPATGHLGGATGGGESLLLNDPGLNCRITGCDVSSTGTEGILLFGKDNIAENNHVYDTGLYSRGCAGVNLLGEHNVVRRNTIHDAPHCGIFFKGVDNIVELNDVHHTVLDSLDMGAIRSVQRNAYLRGNIIRFNKISDTVGYGFRYEEGTHYESPFLTWGIYLDDMTCGTTVFGNIITRSGRGGVEIHGGGDNHVENNIIVNAGQYQLEYLPVPQGAGQRHGPIDKGTSGFPVHVFAGNHAARNILVATVEGGAPYRVGLPTDDFPTMDHNLVWCGGREPSALVLRFTGVWWPAWMKLGYDQGSTVADPRFENAHDGNYRLRPDSPAWKLGFKAMPVDKIGCYKSPERVSWPIQPNQDRFREKPILHTLAGYDPSRSSIPPVRILDPSEKIPIPPAPQ